MTHYTSPYTGNTAYYSENKLFSSLSKEAVLEFESTKIENKFNLCRSTAHRWSFAGQCDIALEYLDDWASAGILRRQYLKDNKKGNWCPLKVESGAFKVFKDYLENLGYVVGPEFNI